MGDVDLLDKYISYYRIHKKICQINLMREIFHFVNFEVEVVEVVEVDCLKFGIPKNEILHLIDLPKKNLKNKR